MSIPPLVSVLVPAFNAARHLGTAIESVLTQTYPALEVVVVDDGSRDDTAQVAQRMAQRDRRVRVLRQTNKGVASARNAAIAASTGEYVAPLDADDVWYPTKVERQVARLEIEGRDTGLAYTWWDGIDERGARQFRSHPWRVEGQIADALVALNVIGHASVPLFRRASLEEVGGYDTTFQAAGAHGVEDWDLSLRVAERSQVAVVPEYLAAYRQSSNSMGRHAERMQRSHALLLQRLRTRRPDVSETLLRWSRGQMCGYSAAVALRDGAVLRAVSLLVRGMMARDTSLLSPWAIQHLVHRVLPAATPLAGRLLARRYNLYS
jgi:glycosyltransferase involved in cell wall biosynthesis